MDPGPDCCSDMIVKPPKLFFWEGLAEGGELILLSDVWLSWD